MSTGMPCLSNQTMKVNLVFYFRTLSIDTTKHLITRSCTKLISNMAAGKRKLPAAADGTTPPRAISSGKKPKIKDLTLPLCETFYSKGE
jgi:hypothetical protein